MTSLRRLSGVALAWGAIWLTVWILLLAILAIVDPDSVDPGDPTGMLAVFGPMGLLSGIAFGCLRLGTGRTQRPDRSLTRLTVLGFLSTAMVQLGYLGHGDNTLGVNLLMALMLAGVGAVVTVLWAMVARLRRQTVA